MKRRAAGKICERWLEFGGYKYVGFWNFVEDVGPKRPNHSLHRIDRNREYGPGNGEGRTTERGQRKTAP
jgi:hypothetical protein